MRRDRLLLAAIVAAAVAVRLAYLYWEVGAPGFQWSDPDGYLRQAATLTRSGHWRWTSDAIEYVWGGQTWVLPPGYPVFLSIFYGASSSSPIAAAVAQAILNGLAAAPVFLIARSLHTPRAGLVAALTWAVWFPAVAGRGTFVQEQLYLPLLWGSFAALAWCLSTPASRGALFWTGLVFGITTMTRAMPLYYLLWLLPLLWWFGRTSRSGLQWPGAFLAGFLVIVLPYVVWLSVTIGQIVFIDNHMMILQTTVSGRESLGTTLTLLISGVTNQADEKLSLARGLFQVYGGSWLYHYGGSVSAEGAKWMGLFVRLCLDTLFVLTCVLAPLGLLLARQRRVAAVLLTWGVFVIVASAMAGFAGPRYRTPLEVILICGAAVVASGDWRRGSWHLSILAVATSLLLAVIVLPQYVGSWQASVPYGLNGWTKRDGRFETFVRGASGFYVPAVNHAISIEIEGGDNSQPAELLATIEGIAVRTVLAEPGEPTTIQVPVGDRVVAFVELSPQGASASASFGYYIRILR